jgi:hypothetical protein
VKARRATALLMAMTALVTVGAADLALADGDPASDVLLFQDAYLPYFPPPSKPEAQTLSRLLGQVRRDGYPMKVALIQSNGDLGAYPDLLGRPDDYAKLLESELAIRVKKPHLLIVMADGGLAGRNLGPDAERILDGIEIDTAAESDGLVRAALRAVAEIASANGHETAVPEIKANELPKAPDGPSHTALYVLSAVIAALGLALIALSFVIRGRRTPG